MSSRPAQVTKIVVYRGGSPMFFLTLLFLGLKLTGYINWAWLWIFAPLWIPVAVCWGMLAGTVMIMLGVAIIGAILASRN